MPVGCLSFLAVVVAFFTLLVLVVFGAMRSTDVYKEALARAQGSAEVTAALGSPLKEGWFLSGKTNVEGSSGDADLAIPITGPKGSGTIYAVARKTAGQWEYTRLEVAVKETGQRIVLQPDAQADE